MGNTDLHARSKMLRARAEDLKTANMIQQAKDGPALVADCLDFMLDLVERAEAIAPYLDERGAA